MKDGGIFQNSFTASDGITAQTGWTREENLLL